jgi:hypothetical protein
MQLGTLLPLGDIGSGALALSRWFGALTFATVAQEKGEHNAIYCRCPGPAR